MQIVLTLVGAYVGVCALLWAFQDRLIFHPRPVAGGPWNPAAQAIEIDRDRVVLHGWVVNAESDGPLIVYFGGNAEEVSGNIDNWARRKATTVLVNYRGYGDSTGRPSERALRADAVEIVKWTRSRYPDRPLVLFGLSLGSGIAALTAPQVNPDAVILISPYRSVEHIARRAMPFIPVRPLLKHRFDAQAVAAELPPALVIASPRDRIIPYDENMAMVDAMESERVVLRTVDAGHLRFMHHPEVWEAVDEFLATVSATPGDEGDG